MSALPRPAAAPLLYLRLVRTLEDQIVRGALPLGARLPPEAMLCRRFKVSRHTVREALRQLRDQGLILSRQGSGSVVAGTGGGQRGRYVHSVASLDELLQYATETSLRVDRTRIVRADAKLAARLDCSPGRRWLSVEGYRFECGGDPPICRVEVYVHPSYAGIRPLLGRHGGPIYSLIEAMYGDTIAEVLQTIRAGTVRSEHAAELGVLPGTACMEIERVYRTVRQKIVEISFSIHPVDRFSYSIVLRREIRGPQA